MSVVRFPVERRQRRLVNLAELQDLMGGSTRWWRYQIAAGLPCHRWGRLLRFCPQEVQSWLDDRRDADGS